MTLPRSSPVADHAVNLRTSKLVASTTVVRMRIKSKESVAGLIIRTIVNGFDVKRSGITAIFPYLPGIAYFTETLLFNICANNV